MKDDCTVAIFCGGKSLRLSPLNELTAKTLLPVYDSPVLWHQLDHLRSAGFSRVVATTTPHLGGAIRKAIDCYAGDGLELEVVVSEEQTRGMLFGLKRLLDECGSDRCLVCLGDIFFLENPFKSFRDTGTSADGYLGISTEGSPEEFLRGGLVYAEHGLVERIVERPVTPVTGTPFRWSGTVLLDRVKAAEDLEAFLATAEADTPPGNFLEFQRARGRRLVCITGPDFVNINSAADLVLASLYAISRELPATSAVHAEVARSAVALRAHVARPIHREA